jgi:hypothetical protein
MSDSSSSGSSSSSSSSSPTVQSLMDFLGTLNERDLSYVAFLAKQRGHQNVLDALGGKFGEKTEQIVAEEDEKIQRRMIGTIHESMSHRKCRCVCDVSSYAACSPNSHRRCRNCTTSGSFYCYSHYCAINGREPPEIEMRREALTPGDPTSEKL